MKINAGQAIEPLTLPTIRGSEVSVPDEEGRWVHLQFRRFAGCPICNLHLRTMAQRHDEIRAAGIRTVALFHSTDEDMQPYQGDLPFDAVADPGKSRYRQFGVESSAWSVLHPAVLIPFLKGIFARHRYGMFAGDEGGHLGLPADFLIGPDGVIAHAKYGRHAYDHWEVDELLSLAKSAK